MSMRMPAILLADGSWGSLEDAIIFDFAAIPDGECMESEEVIDYVRGEHVQTTTIHLAVNKEPTDDV